MLEEQKERAEGDAERAADEAAQPCQQHLAADGCRGLTMPPADYTVGAYLAMTAKSYLTARGHGLSSCFLHASDLRKSRRNGREDLALARRFQRGSVSVVTLALRAVVTSGTFCHFHE